MAARRIIVKNLAGLETFLLFLGSRLEFVATRPSIHAVQRTVSLGDVSVREWRWLLFAVWC